MNKERAGVDFLDFLFTVAISIGLTPEILQINGVTGLLSEPWNLQGTSISSDDAFNLGVFFLGLFNLTLSWFGYYASIISRPLSYTSGFGMARFVIDVFLVLMFGVMLIKHKSFDVVLVLLVAIYLSYVVWDALKIGEYWDSEFKEKKGNHLKRFRREWVTVFAFVTVALIAVFYFCFQMDRWYALALAIAISVFYRVNKIYPTWETLLGVK